ncbi:MAG: GNAT family N-acetyltransferase [Actinomycetota bacterium]
MSFTIRPATTADAHEIAQVHVSAWREAYAHLFPQAFLAGLDVDVRARRWEQILADGQTRVTVAETAEGEVIGWASSGPGRDDDAPVDRELEGIYVLSAHQGSGVSGELLLESVGKGPAYLWVAEDNPRARSFYLRHGFTLDGGRKVEAVGGIDLVEVRMTRR